MGGFPRSCSMINWLPARGTHHLRFMYVCKSDTRVMGKETDVEDVPKDLSRSIRDLHRGFKRGEEKTWLTYHWEMSAWRKVNKATSGENYFTCMRCNRDCQSRVGQYSQNKLCIIISSWSIKLWRQIHFFLEIDGCHTCVCDKFITCFIQLTLMSSLESVNQSVERLLIYWIYIGFQRTNYFKL